MAKSSPFPWPPARVRHLGVPRSDSGEKSVGLRNAARREPGGRRWATGSPLLPPPQQQPPWRAEARWVGRGRRQAAGATRGARKGERGTRMEVSTPHFDRAGGVGATLLLLGRRHRRHSSMSLRRRRHSPRRLSLGTRRRAGGAGQDDRRLFLMHLAGDPPAGRSKRRRHS